MSYKKLQEGWLEKLQDSSWQIELLISGGIVYTLYQLPDYFQRRFIFTYENTEFNDTILLTLISIYLITRILLIGFSINLFLRAIWVAFIGIHATFPNGINRYESKKSEWINHRFPKKMDSKKRLDEFEAVCNLSYALCILMSLMSVSIIILMFIIFNTINALPYSLILDSIAFKYAMAFFAMFMVLGDMDAWVFRITKNRPALQKWSQYFFKFWEAITFAFVYKKEWLILITNIRAWKIRLLMSSYFIIGLLVSINQIGDYLTLDGLFHIDPLEQRDHLNLPNVYKASYNRYYDNLPPKKSFTLQGCINDDIIKDRFMWVFVTYWKDMDETLDYYFEQNQVITKWRDINGYDDRFRTDSLQQLALAQMLNVHIDGKKIENLEWYETQLVKTAEKGFIAYIDTDSLGIGAHRMRVGINEFNWKDEMVNRALFRVPFWKE